MLAALQYILHSTITTVDFNLPRGHSNDERKCQACSKIYVISVLFCNLVLDAHNMNRLSNAHKIGVKGSELF